MDATNLRFMFYGFSAAWLVVIAYILILVRRGQRLDRELARLKNMVGEGQSK